MFTKLLSSAALALALIQAAHPLTAQTLSLSSATAPGPGAVSLNLTLANSSGAIGALQWTFQYPQASFGTFTAAAGTALTASGKSIYCASGTGSYTCIASGINSSAIGNGVVAVITATALQTASVSVANVVASSPGGNSMPVSATGGTVTVSSAAPVLSSLACNPTSLTGASSSTCTVTMSGAVASATSAALNSNNAAIVVPASVTIAAGSSTATFSAVSSSGGNGTVTLTATVNGTSKTATLVLATGAFTAHVNSGGGAFTDSSGVAWSADQNFSGGSTFSVNSSISGTTNSALYQTCRYGAFSYTFSVPNGSYTVTLKFAELSRFGAGQRQFNVALNGGAVLSNFDIYAQAGALTAIDKVFPVAVSGGAITIQFTNGAADAPLVSGIDIEPGTALTSIRLNSGGLAYTDGSGKAWAADNSYSGGATWSTAASIGKTSMPSLYQTCRYGSFTYSLAIPNGSYTATLKFAEISRTAAGQRLFNVAINGIQVLSNFDIFAQAGGENIALDKAFPVNVSNGSVVIQFTNGSSDAPLVSAIDIEPAGSLPSTRLNSGGTSYTDASGNVWAADNSYSGGATWSTSATIAGTPASALYQTCRYGAFTYTLTVPNGSYNVILKFAEVSRTAAGQRLFNVAINGSQVLTNFDVFAQAGGENIALDKTFPVTVSGGMITIQFSNGSSDSPLVNAIDVEPAQ